MQCLTPEYIKNPKWIGIGEKYIPVPCGKCYNCIITRANAWTGRLSLESKKADFSFFVTLTYDDEHLPFNGNLPCVSKVDLQKYFKRLRKALPDYKCKYYAVSEYGTQTLRPHYHYIIFFYNDEIYEYRAEMEKLTKNIEQCWNMGFVTTDKVLDNRIRYIVLYTTYKCKIPEQFVKPFSLISKGLGIIEHNYENYLHEHLDNRFLCVDGNKYPLHRYNIDKIYSEEEKAEYQSLLSQNPADNDTDDIFRNYHLSKHLIEDKLFKNKHKLL